MLFKDLRHKIYERLYFDCRNYLNKFNKPFFFFLKKENLQKMFIHKKFLLSFFEFFSLKVNLFNGQFPPKKTLNTVVYEMCLSKLHYKYSERVCISETMT